MNWDQLEGRWHQVKGTIRAKWGKLTDDDVRSVAGSKEVLTGKLQERYGLLKDEAEKQANEWIAKLAVEMDVEVPGGEAATEKKGRREHEAEGGAAGAVAGGVLGAVGGPPGVVAGAVIGAAAGALAGFAADRESAARETEEAKLDREIGVSDGELGAPNLEHPPATVGTYSGSSTGTSSTDGEAPAEGPMQPPNP